MNLITFKSIKYFQSNLFKKHNFIHSFFTKRYEKNVPIELENELILNSNINFLKQVHSNKIVQINNISDSKLKIADCLITKEKKQSLWIYTADCMPILIADIKTRNIAACHSGLKGLKKRIISKTLKTFEAIGSKKDNLIIAIGPSISGENYQVKIQDVDNLINSLSGRSYIEKSPLIKSREGDIIPLFKKDSRTDRLLFDIKAAAILELYKEDIKQHQIDLDRNCTYSDPKLFNSFRRDKTNLRQWSCIYS
tara:strand:+ start:46 stop:801 length:756 start_codon:yes stop_codon:yes gene_type:complete